MSQPFNPLDLLNKEHPVSTDPTAFRIQFDPQQRRMAGITRIGHIPFDVPFISPVTDTLWQGGCEDGLILPVEVKHVISLYPWEKYTIEHEATYDSFKMYDSDEVNEEFVFTAARLVNEYRRDGVTLVHCQAGLNRSALVAATALILDGMYPQDAINLLREKRGSEAVLCNSTFERWLLGRS